MRFFTFIILLFSYLLLSSFGFAATTVERIVAVVNNEIITQSDLDEAWQKKEALALSGRKMPSTRDQMLQVMLNEKILKSEIDREKIEVSPTELSNAFREILTKNRASENEFRMKLAAEGISLDEFKDKLKLDLQRNQFFQKIIYPKIQITDFDLETYYHQHPELGQSFAKIRFLEIFLPAEGATVDPQAQANELITQLKKGKPFGELAKKYSYGAFANQNGDSGLIDTKNMRSDLVDVLLKLPLNQISPPLPNSQGVFIFKVLEKKEATQRPFTEVKNAVRQHYVDNRIEEELDRYLMQARTRNFVQLKDNPQ